MKKLSIFFFAFALILLSVSAVSATVNEVNNIRYAIRENDGTLTQTTSPVTNSEAIAFICANSDCSSVSGALYTQPKTTGSSSSMTLDYPTTLQGTGYGVFFYKGGFIPYEAKVTWSGTGNAPVATDYLSQKRVCTATILGADFKYENNEIKGNAAVKAPISHSGPLNLVPEQIASHYKVKVSVTFTVTGPETHTETKVIDMPFSDQPTIFFSYTPQISGNYHTEITTSVNDGKCLSSTTEQKEKDIDLTVPGSGENITLSIINPKNQTYTTTQIPVEIQATNADTITFSTTSITNRVYTGATTITLPQGHHTLTVTASNNEGKTATASVQFTINTGGGNGNQTDTTPPAPVTNLHVIDKGTNFILWGWNNPSDSDFGAAIVFLDGVHKVDTAAGFYNATALSPSTSYTITINTKDTSGNINGQDVSSTATTLSSGGNGGGNETDTTPPASVTGLRVRDRGISFIEWTWNNPSDQDFAAAIIYFDGVNVVNTTNNFYRATGLREGTRYRITINTKDASGNVNHNDVSHTARTLSDRDDDDDNGGGNGNGDDDSDPEPLEDFPEQPRIIYTELDEPINATIQDGRITTTITTTQVRPFNWFWLMILLAIACFLLLILLILLAWSRSTEL